MNANRLLLLTSDFPPQRGGVARYLELLSQYFSSRMTVVTSVPGAEALNPSVHERVLLSRFFWPRWIRSVLELMTWKDQYEIVMISHLLPFGTAACIASWFSRKPYVVILHGMDVRLAGHSVWKRMLVRVVLGHARLVVANSNALAQEVAVRFRVPMPLVVYPCVTDVVAPVRLQNPSTPLHLLSVSRLVQRKGHVHVLMALSRLKQTGRLKPFRYDIVGEGPMRETLASLAHELHLNEVVFHGDVDEAKKSELYAQADLFLMPVLDDPIDKEGFGFVYLEAAQYGVPSIGSHIKGVDEAILDGETGVLIEPGNIEHLASAIEQLVTNPERRIQLGNQAQARVRKDFTCQKQFAKLEPYL